MRSYNFWLIPAILAILLLVIYYLNYLYLKAGVIPISIPPILAVLPFVIQCWTKEQEVKSKKRNIGQEIKKIRDYLQNFFDYALVTPYIKEFQNEEDIHRQFLKQNFPQLDAIAINSVLLCFYCHLWDKTNSPDEYEKIQKYSHSIGLSFASINEQTKKFLKIFYSFQQDNKFRSFEGILNTAEPDYKVVLKEFSQKYLKELAFFYIRERLSQSENLRETLIKLIKEGELSNWGITQRTLEELEAYLKKEIGYSKSFLVIGNKLSNEIKNYLISQPGLDGWSPKMRHTPKLGLERERYSAYIIKPRGIYPDAKKLINKLKSMHMNKKESILFVVPLDLLNCESFTLPSNQSFSTQHLKDRYEAINWFRTGYGYSDTDIWSVIGKSSITPQELLAIIPFNIFCKGILPCEQTFMIRNYKKIKDKCGVKILTDWKDKNVDLVVDYLLECGIPTYNKKEKGQILKVGDKDIKNAVRQRIEKLVKQIKENSCELDKSLSLMPK